MKDNISIIFAAIIGTFLIVIMPLYSILDRQDSMSYNVVLTETTKFVDNIRNNGFLTKEDYYNYISALASTSNTYKVSIEAYKRVLINDTDDTGKIIKDSYVEELELYNTKDILKILEAEEINTEATSIGRNNTYLFNENDEIYVRVHNTNITSGSIIYNLFTGNSKRDTNVINVNYGGVVNKINWELYNKIQEETAEVPEVILSVPVNNNGSTNIKKITGEGNIIDINCNNTEGYTEAELALYCEDINIIKTGENYIYLYNLENVENKTIKLSVELQRFQSINAGLSEAGEETYIDLAILDEQQFEKIEDNIIDKFIVLNGMYADIDLEYRGKEDYYAFDVILKNVRMASLDYISNIASVSILPGLGKDEHGTLSLGAETVKLELVDRQLAHSLVISHPYNFKQMVRAGLRAASITDGKVYKNQELAFIVSYTGIDTTEKTKEDIVNALKTGLKVYGEGVSHTPIEILTMDDVSKRYGNAIVKELSETSYSEHLMVRITYTETNTDTINYIELADGWIDTGIDWTGAGYNEEDIIIFANGSKSTEYIILNDDEPPIAPTIVYNGILDKNGWYTTDVAVNVISSKVDTIKQKDLYPNSTSNSPVIGGSGVYKNTIKITGAVNLEETELIDQVISIQGESRIIAYAYDYVGNVISTQTHDLKIDKEIPTKPVINLSGNKGTNGWFLDDVTVSIIPGKDNISGVARTTYSVEGTDSRKETVGTEFKITKGGKNTITAITYDNAGNKAISTIDVYIDRDMPTSATIKVISGNKTEVGNEWYVSPVTLQVTIPDEDKNTASGIGEIYYVIYGPNAVPKTILSKKTTNITISENGIHELNVYVSTLAGNVQKTSYQIKIDKTPPNAPTALIFGVFGENDWYTSDVRVRVKSNNDIGPSLERYISYTLSTNNTTTNETIIKSDTEFSIIQDGNYTLNVYSRDNAGNKAVTAKTIKKDTTPPKSAKFIIEGTKGKNGWYTSNVTISNDGGYDATSGVQSVVQSENTITSNTKGTTITMTTKDNAGFITTTSTIIKVDKEKPSGLKINLDEPTGSGIAGVNLYNKPVKVSVTPAVDFVQGVDNVDKTTIEIRKENNGQMVVYTPEDKYLSETIISENGKYNIIARTYDKAGNVQVVTKVVWIDNTSVLGPEIISVNDNEALTPTNVTLTDKSRKIKVELTNVEVGNIINILVEDANGNKKEITEVVSKTKTIEIDVSRRGQYIITLNQQNMYGTISEQASTISYTYN